MTLSLTRAIEHDVAGITDSISDPLQVFTFTHDGITFAVPLRSDNSIMVGTSLDGSDNDGDDGFVVNTVIATKRTSSPDTAIYLAHGEVVGKKLTLKLNSVSFSASCDAIGAGAVERALEGAGWALSGSIPRLTSDERADRRRALNDSLMEVFIWSALIDTARRFVDNDFETVILHVNPVDISETISREDVNGGPIDFDFSQKSAVPGIRYERLLRDEYNSAVESLHGELKVSDICAVSGTSSCMGKDKECGYDDYIFARAAGKCSYCAQSENARRKFEVE